MPQLDTGETTLLAASLALHAVGALLGLWYLFSSRRPATRPTVVVIALGFALLTAMLVWRARRMGALPIGSTRVEGLLLLVWGVVLVYLALGWRPRAAALPAFIMPVVCALEIGALIAGRRDGTGEAYFDDPWILAHILSAMLAYATFVTAFATGVMYLIQERQLRAKRWTQLTRRLPPIESLEAIAVRALLVGFPLLTFALVVGGARAAVLDEPTWIRDPKVVSAWAMWLFYAGCLAARRLKRLSGRKMAYLSILGFAGVVFTYVVTGLLSTPGHPFR